MKDSQPLGGANVFDIPFELLGQLLKGVLPWPLKPQLALIGDRIVLAVRSGDQGLSTEFTRDPDTTLDWLRLQLALLGCNTLAARPLHPLPSPSRN